MNSTNKKSPAARGIPQPFNRPTRPAPQTKPVVAQFKTGVPAQNIKQPVAPPVYRPQPVPKAMQRKMANVAAKAEPSLALPVSSSQPPLRTSAVSPFRSVVQRAKVGRRGGGGGGGKKPPGGKPPAPDHYADASLKMNKYGMAEDYQRWLILGKKIGIKGPDLSGVHAGNNSKAGGKAEKERHKQITAIMDDWKEGLFLYLSAVLGIQETKLGKIERALEKK